MMPSQPSTPNAIDAPARPQVCRAPAARRSLRARRGSALFAVLVCTALAAMIALGLLRAALNEQLQLRVEQRSVQAERVAEAALARAAARLRAAPDYEGETWRTPADAMAGHLPAVAVIRVEKIADRPSERRVIVQADYPDHPAHRARKTSEAVVRLAAQEAR